MNANKIVGGLVIAAAVCGCAYIFLANEPRLQVNVADGRYSNKCCGVITLNNGTLTATKQRVGYVIERDKFGPYVLPEAYVGVSSKGFVIKPNAVALKLRPDDRAHPYQVELSDDGPDIKSYSFVRLGGS